MHEDRHESLRRITIVLFLCAIVLSGPTARALEIASSVVVYLIDKETGVPIEGADLRLVATLKQARSMRQQQSSVLMFPDEAGVYRVENVIPGEYVIQAVTEGYPITFAGLEVANGRASRVVVQMNKAATIRGTVTDEAGVPLRGARLILAYTDEDMLSLLEQMSHTRQLASALSDELGRYEFAGVVPMNTPFVLEVAHDDFVTKLTKEYTIREDETEPIDIVLDEQGANLIGKVMDHNGNPIEGATVAIRAQAFAGGGKLLLSGGREVGAKTLRYSLIASESTARARQQSLTAVDGTFTLRCVRPGEVKIRVRRRGYEVHNEIIFLDKGDNTIEVFLQPK